jgi:hypothetical protein
MAFSMHALFNNFISIGCLEFKQDQGHRMLTGEVADKFVRMLTGKFANKFLRMLTGEVADKFVRMLAGEVLTSLFAC